MAVGLRSATGISGIEETTARALSKLEQVLPHRLRRQVTALNEATEKGPENTGSNVEDPEVDPTVLAAVAAAIRDHEGIRCWYADEPVALEPYRLVSWQRRWYVVGREVPTGRWAPYRLDKMIIRTPGGRRFVPAPLPGGDYPGFVLREVAAAGWNVHARIVVLAPASDVLARINSTVGVVEAVDDQTSVLVTGGDSVAVVAVYIGMLGLDFRVTDPPELVTELRCVGERYLRAVQPAASS